MTHDPADPVHEAPSVWVVECSCGHRAQGQHPNSATGKHDQHAAIEDARSALRGGR